MSHASTLTSLTAALCCAALTPGCYAPKDAQAAAGAVANEACARLFISELSEDEALAHPRPLVERILPSASAYPTITVNADMSVTATTGSASATSIYREGLGCTLLVAKSAEAVKAEAVEAPDLGAPASGAWPRGDGGPVELPPSLYADWDRVVLRDLYGDGANELQTFAVAVALGGQLVYERYGEEVDPANSVKADTRLCGFSMTKTLLALGLGTLWDRGAFQLDAPLPVDEWQANPQETRRDSWRDFLHMEANIAYNEAGNGVQYARVFELLFRNGDTARYMGGRGKRPYYQAVHTYSTGTSILLSRELQQLLASESDGTRPGYQLALDHFASQLFRPSHVTSAVFAADEAGTLQGGSYAYLTTRDWLRLGQLFLDEGKVDGVPVVSKEWIDFMKAPSRASDYGGHIWRITLDLPAPEGAPVPTTQAFAFVGVGGQVVAVVPEFELVYARLGATWNGGDAEGANVLALQNLLAALVGP